MEDQELLLKDFHALNNWLNKITMFAGQARHELETRGFNARDLEEEKKRYIRLLNDMEDHAMKVGEILKDMRKRIKKA